VLSSVAAAQIPDKETHEMKKSGLAVVTCAVAGVLAGAPTAFAGEATGNFQRTGKTTPIAQFRAASICSFSGQNPERFLDPSNPDYEPGRTQSWGQIPRQVRATMPASMHPGSACNGHTGFLAGGGSE
jgi:hypothetical protein